MVQVKPKRIIFDIHPDLHRQVKIHASKEGITIRELMMQRLEPILSSSEAEGAGVKA